MAITKKKDDEAQVLVANSGGVLKVKGVRYMYRRGQAFPADHPLVRAIPNRFGPIRVAGMKAPPEVRTVAPLPEINAED